MPKEHTLHRHNRKTKRKEKGLHAKFTLIEVCAKFQLSTVITVILFGIVS